MESPVFSARFKILLSRASENGRKTALSKSASAGSTAAFDAASSALGDGKHKEDALLSTCQQQYGGEDPQIASARSFKNLQTLLNGEFNEDAIFKALGMAITAKKVDHVAALVDYAKEKFPDIICRRTPDNSTLLIKALSVGEHRGKYDTNDNVAVERMALKLASAMDANFAMEADGKGNSPLAILAHRGMEHSAAYLTISRMMQNKIDVAFVGERVRAEIGARLEMAQQMKALGLDSTIIAAVLNAQPQSKALPPGAGPHSTKLLGGGDASTQRGA